MIRNSKSYSKEKYEYNRWYNKFKNKFEYYTKYTTISFCFIYKNSLYPLIKNKGEKK